MVDISRAGRARWNCDEHEAMRQRKMTAPVICKYTRNITKTEEPIVISRKPPWKLVINRKGSLLLVAGKLAVPLSPPAITNDPSGRSTFTLSQTNYIFRIGTIGEFH
jgi:hypothetical protein